MSARSPHRSVAAVATAAALLGYVGCGRPAAPEPGPDSQPPAAAAAGPAASPAPEPAAAPPEAAGDASKDSREFFERWDGLKAVLIVSGETDGYLEPCGCTMGQMGGMIRRQELVERMKAKGVPYALIDLGGLTKDPTASRGGFDQAKIKFGIALKALAAFPYSAVALGADDFKVGVGEAFGQLLNYQDAATKPLSANLVAAEGLDAGVRPSLVVEAGQVKLGVTAVIDPDAIARLSDPDKDAWISAVKKPDDVLPEILKDLEAKSDYQVLMVQAPPAEARRLAEAFPGFDVVVATSEAPDPEADPKIVNDGATMIVNVGRRGKYVGAVGFLDGGAPKYRRVALTEKYDSRGNEVKKIIEDEYRGLLKAVGTVVKFPRRGYVGGAPGAKFVGAESCRDCHPNTFLKWASTKHAHAFESLERDPKPNVIYDVECVSCHTTGFEYDSGWVSAEATPALKGNQCENCHGPASKHVADPDDETFRNALKLTAEQADKNRLCARCHDEDNSPKFDFPGYWAQVAHKGLDAYADPKVHRGAAPPKAD